MQSVSIKNKLPFNIPNAIRDVLLVDYLGRTPAMCLRVTRTMFVTPEFLKLPKDYQCFIVGHEAGHIDLDTKNEFYADDYAVDWCLGEGIRLTNILFAMTKVLSFPEDKPNQRKEQILRCQRQAKRVFDYDYNINNNKNAIMENNQVTEELDSFFGLLAAGKAISRQPQPKYREEYASPQEEEQITQFVQESQEPYYEEVSSNENYTEDNHYEDEPTSFLGMGKEARARRGDRRERRNERTQSKADARRMKAEAKLTKAETPEAEKPTEAASTQKVEATGMSKNTIYIIIAAVVLLGVAAWYFTSNKTATN
jgi:hypothetical protein